MNPPVNASTPKSTFANVIQQEKLLTREHAIIVDSIDGHSVEEYALSLAKVMDPKDILYASRINQNRICFYLSKKEIVDNLLENRTNILIGTVSLTIRPLVSKAKRVMISNVQPCIPTSAILDELQKLDITPVSQITPIRTGTQHPSLSHLLSFRKQVYIKPEDEPKIPNNLRITYENVNFGYIFHQTNSRASYAKKKATSLNTAEILKIESYQTKKT